MAMDPIWIWIALGAVAVLIVAGVFARGANHTHTSEREPVARGTEIRKYDIRPLTTAERNRYQREWTRIEHHFVTRPAAAVVEAGELLTDIMRIQGYPMGDFERHAATLSVKHPRVVEHYRAGHRIRSGVPGRASIEELRQAMLHFRSLFEELLGGSDFERELPREDELRSASPRRDVVTRDEDRL